MTHEKHWEEFKLIRKTVKSKLNKSHQNYISQLLEVDEEKHLYLEKSFGNT